MRAKGMTSMIVFLMTVMLTLLFAGAGYAQEEIVKYPSKPVTFIVPLPPGGPTDLAARLICKEAEKYLKQPVVMVNKPGAALAIGVAAIGSARPDGYTIGYCGGPPIFIIPLLEKVPYDPLKDFRYVMQFGGFNFGVYVSADSPFKTFKDLIAYAHQNPKKATYGTSGTNSPAYLTMEQIARQEQVQITHIPFKGTPEVQTALLGGHVVFGAGDFNASFVEAKQIRLLMLLKDEPSAEYPDVPILKDLGYNFRFPIILGIVCPKATPDAIVAKLDEAFGRAMKEPAFLSGMKELRLPVMYRSGKELDPYIPQNYAYFQKLLKEQGAIK
jgi:tripartite-type tricarboxylate transporter receptor subunit TctC